MSRMQHAAMIENVGGDSSHDNIGRMLACVESFGNQMGKHLVTPTPQHERRYNSADDSEHMCSVIQEKLNQR